MPPVHRCKELRRGDGRRLCALALARTPPSRSGGGTLFWRTGYNERRTVALVEVHEGAHHPGIELGSGRCRNLLHGSVHRLALSVRAIMSYGVEGVSDGYDRRGQRNLVCYQPVGLGAGYQPADRPQTRRENLAKDAR